MTLSLLLIKDFIGGRVMDSSEFIRGYLYELFSDEVSFEEFFIFV